MATARAMLYGFQVGGCVGAANISNNTISNITAAGAGIYVFSGEQLEDPYNAGLQRMTINNNNVMQLQEGYIGF